MNVFTRLTPFSNMLDLLCQIIVSGGFRKLCAIECFVGLLSCVLYEAYQAGRSFVLCCCRRLRICLRRRVPVPKSILRRPSSFNRNANERRVAWKTTVKVRRIYSCHSISDEHYAFLVRPPKAIILATSSQSKNVPSVHVPPQTACQGVPSWVSREDKALLSTCADEEEAVDGVACAEEVLRRTAQDVAASASSGVVTRSTGAPSCGSSKNLAPRCRIPHIRTCPIGATHVHAFCLRLNNN